MTYLEPCKFVILREDFGSFPSTARRCVTWKRAIWPDVVARIGHSTFQQTWRRPAARSEQYTTLFFNGYVQLNTAEDRGTVRRTAVDQWHDCCNNTVECRDNCTDLVKLLMHTTTQLRADHKKTSFNQC